MRYVKSDIQQPKEAPKPKEWTEVSQNEIGDALNEIKEMLLGLIEKIEKREV